jgi:Fe-S oxidoreductase
MNFNPFVLPFLAGSIFFFVVIIYKFIQWILHLDSSQSTLIKKNIFTLKTLYAIIEVFRESLVHRNIYKKNLLLGYMHMSLAFGWFLIILMGKIESSVYFGTFFDEPWTGVFFRYFVRNPYGFFVRGVFPFVMDLLLLIILSGVLLALIKRLRSNLMGIKKATKHILPDRIALASLWGIFPLRLLAESVTASLSGNGAFLTGAIGNLLHPLPVGALELPLWWAYSLFLGGFFVTLPYTRYMHIPTEVLLIFLRKWGTKEVESYSGFTDVQLNSCSRCGICIDACQLNFAADIHNVQPVYLIRDARNKKLTDEVTNNCLLCGRCVKACPVGLELTSIRQLLRYKPDVQGKQFYTNSLEKTCSEKVDVVYFAGCMTHLTPSIIVSMKKIFEKSGEKFWFMDENNGLCCGRPLRLQGFLQQSKDLVNRNKSLIASSGAKLLVTSCPICYNSFKNVYNLNIEVMHHTEYIDFLINNGRLNVNRSEFDVVYHDPCELGRGCGIYEPPRKVLRHVGNLRQVDYEKENALCCGGSLANTEMEMDSQRKVQNQVLDVLTKSNPDAIITACPLCKKTLSQGNAIKVMDISEIVSLNII